MAKLNGDFYENDFENDFSTLEANNGYEFDDDDDEMMEFDDDDDEMMEFDDDDDEMMEFYDDDESREYDDDDDEAEFFMGRRLRQLRRANKRMMRNQWKMNKFKFRRPRWSPPRIPRTSKSNLRGALLSRSGRKIQFNLPKNVATTKHVQELRTGIKTVSNNTRKNSQAIRLNVSNIKKVVSKSRSSDRKNIAVNARQNRIIGTLNKRVNSLKKDLDATKQQAQMTSMMSMISKPELSSITIDPATPITTGTPLTVSNSDNDDNNLGLMMALSGGFGGSSSSGGDDNSMMMMMMMMALQD